MTARRSIQTGFSYHSSTAPCYLYILLQGARHQPNLFQKQALRLLRIGLWTNSLFVQPVARSGCTSWIASSCNLTSVLWLISQIVRQLHEIVAGDCRWIYYHRWNDIDTGGAIALDFSAHSGTFTKSVKLACSKTSDGTDSYLSSAFSLTVTDCTPANAVGQPVSPLSKTVTRTATQDGPTETSWVRSDFFTIT